MSNPIGEPAGYFAKRQGQKHGRDTTLGLANLQHSPTQPTNDPLSSPASPDSRRKPNDKQQQQQDSNFDPRAQWQRMLQKISFNGSQGSGSYRSRVHSSFQHKHKGDAMDGNKDGQDNGDRTDSDNNSGNGEHVELSMMESRFGKPSRYQHHDQDATLPTPQEVEDAATNTKMDHNNYFAQPFSPDKVPSSSSRPVNTTTDHGHSDTLERTEQEDHNGSDSGSDLHNDSTDTDKQAKHHWGKTFDKVRLIAHLQKPHVAVDHYPDTDASTSLAPYCSALFDPPFVALSKDGHGRRPPPILLQFLHLNITDSRLDTQGINQWVFRVELQYGDVKWVIHRTITDFVSLHYTLKIKANLSDNVAAPPNFPNQLQSWINSARETLWRDDNGNREDVDGSGGGKENTEIALNRRRELTKYLQKLLNRAHILVSYDICEFLEISAISIVQDMGWKGKEGYMENRVNFVTPRFCQFVRPHLWQKEWVILRDSFIAFCNDIGSTSPTDVLVLDKSFRITTKYPGIFSRYHHHITLSNSFRRIEIKGSKRQMDEWLNGITKVQEESPWVKNHRFGSFAPIRYNSKVKWFVDAENHYNAVAEAILSARTEIYICDWWLSPELYLRRPPAKNQEFRIDRLLQRKAREGVMIYIVIYKEMSLALPINSAHTKLWLQNCHPNIIVQRHPDHRSIENNVLFWSHHEKIVIVDNRLAFVGGLDLCYGRYDAHDHTIIDAPAEGIEHEMFPGQDYSNPRVKDFANVADYNLTLVDKKITARMPWHDMTIGVVGPAARDVARHFVQRWNFLKASKGMHRSSVPFLMPKGEYVAARDESKFKGTCRTQVLRSSAEWSSGIDREHSIYNAYMECISKAKHYVYMENQFFVSSTTYDRILRNKIGQAIVERIKKAHAKGEKFKIFILIPLIPAFEGDLASADASSARTVMHFQYVSISRGGNSIMEKLKEAGIDGTEYIGWYCLRNWAKNKPTAEAFDDTDKRTDSGTGVEHQDGIIHDTSKSNRSSQPSSSSSKLSQPNGLPSRRTPLMATDTVVNDPIQNSAYLEAANDTSSDDRKHYVSELIYIHDKLLIVDDRIVLVGSANINDRSQLGNRDSEIAMIIEDTDLVETYMDGKKYNASKFALSLRLQLMKEHLGLLEFDDWDKFLQDNQYHPANQAPATRPIRPKTATEEEIKVYEQARPDQVLDGESTEKTRNGINQSDNAEKDNTTISDEKRAMDPLSDQFYYNVWRRTANTNTLVYRDLFRCVPDDTVTTFAEHRQFLPSNVPHGHVADPSLSEEEILDKLAKVQGHLVEFPTDYLKNENMLGSLIRETVTPMIIFT
ncbi:hypothetical protein BC941DRAFT_455475 [Chlamydoabsidia padenii]|nr:hypothetical protein BC941DRAFT_455475 [Chlamydoabsidia padenii]